MYRPGPNRASTLSTSDLSPGHFPFLEVAARHSISDHKTPPKSSRQQRPQKAASGLMASVAPETLELRAILAGLSRSFERQVRQKWRTHADESSVGGFIRGDTEQP
jgi:hypothetical protein